jgi:hypothetical protein
MINPIKYFYYNIMPAEIQNKINQMRIPKLNPKNAYSQAFDASSSIFIHIPKTAGTSVSQAIYQEQPKHHSVHTFQKLDNEKFEKYFKFAFVRDPFERLYSIYNYARKISHPIYKGPLTEVSDFDTFERFVIEWCTESRIKSHYFLKPQFDYLSLDGTQLNVNFVGRFENIEDDFNNLCNLLNINASLPMINVGTQKKLNKIYYTNEMRRNVEQIYLYDFENFGY